MCRRKGLRFLYTAADKAVFFAEKPAVLWRKPNDYSFFRKNRFLFCI